MSTDKMQYQYLTTQQIKKDAGDDLIEHGPRDSSDRQGLSMLNETEQNVTYPNWPLWFAPSHEDQSRFFA